MKLHHVIITASIAALALAACDKDTVLSDQQHANVELAARSHFETFGEKFASCSGQDTNSKGYVTCTGRDANGRPHELHCSYKGAAKDNGCKEKQF